MLLPKELYKRIPIIIFYIVLTAAVGYVFFRFLLPVLLPFIISWVAALLLQGAVNRMNTKLKLPRRLAAAVLVFAAAAIISVALYFIAERVYAELTELVESAGRFLTHARDDPEFAGKMIDKIASAVPFGDIRPWLTETWQNLDTVLAEKATDIIARITTGVLPMLGGIVSFVPQALMCVFVVVLSAYYFTVDFDRINRTAVKLLPQSLRHYASVAKKELRGTIGKLIGAYCIIFIITFAELFIALSLIGIRYSLIIAFLISFVDLLPVLGTGTVMIPWGIVLILFGQTGTGAAILGAYIIITIVREITEPRIVGKSIGLHPLAALLCMYVGLKFFGILGMLFVPIAATLVKNIYTKAKSSSP